MAVTPTKPVSLPRVQGGRAIVDDAQRPMSDFVRTLNDAFAQVERAFTAIGNILGITDQLGQQVSDAQRAVALAQKAASDAQDAADQATQQAAAQKREAAIQASYIDPSSVLSASPTLITIAAHTRYYGDGTSAAVNGGTVAATASGDTDYVSYSDPSRAGGDVAYQVTTTQPVQTGDTHVVGAVMIPATGTQAGGDGPRLPGYVQAKMPEQ